MVGWMLALALMGLDNGKPAPGLPRPPATQTAPQTAPQTVPAACRPGAEGRVDYAACAAATPREDGMHSLSAINLGTQAYLMGDVTTALRWYDEAELPGKEISSDVFFHAFRADAYQQGGRPAPALKDAQRAWRLMENPALYPAPGDVIPLNDGARGYLLNLILPILKSGGDEAELTAAKAVFLALPAEDAVGLSNRAGVLEKIEDVPNALTASERAVALAPADPQVLNNHCFILYRAGRAGEAVGVCERALEHVAGLPPGAEAAVRHSYATALAAIGRCREAEEALSVSRRLNPINPLYAEALACAPAV